MEEVVEAVALSGEGGIEVRKLPGWELAAHEEIRLLENRVRLFGMITGGLLAVLMVLLGVLLWRHGDVLRPLWEVLFDPAGDFETGLVLSFLLVGGVCVGLVTLLVRGIVRGVILSVIGTVVMLLILRPVSAIGAGDAHRAWALLVMGLMGLWVSCLVRLVFVDSTALKVLGGICAAVVMLCSLLMVICPVIRPCRGWERFLLLTPCVASLLALLNIGPTKKAGRVLNCLTLTMLVIFSVILWVCMAALLALIPVLRRMGPCSVSSPMAGGPSVPGWCYLLAPGCVLILFFLLIIGVSDMLCNVLLKRRRGMLAERGLGV
jgi:FtsH-binding integral membrane protein